MVRVENLILIGLSFCPDPIHCLLTSDTGDHRRHQMLRRLQLRHLLISRLRQKPFVRVGVPFRNEELVVLGEGKTSLHLHPNQSLNQDKPVLG